MNQSDQDFFLKLLTNHGISGDEQDVQDCVRDFAGSFADSVRTDLHGNVIASINPDATLKVMVAGHCDQIGLIVTHIDDQGFLSFQTVGGWDVHNLVGQRVRIKGLSGQVKGVLGRKPIHLQNESDRGTLAKVSDLWIDIGVTDKEQAESLVEIGASVALDIDPVFLQNDLITGSALDDRSGLWIVLKSLQIAKEKGCSVGIFAVSTVAEEIGTRGATTAAEAIAPTVGIAVDVTHATDCPTIDAKTIGTVQLGKGPVLFRGPNMNQAVSRKLIDSATADNLPFQLRALGRAAPNDSNPIQISGTGVAAGLIGVPNRYMHSGVEVVSLKDLQAAAELLAHFFCKLTNDDSFIPTAS